MPRATGWGDTFTYLDTTFFRDDKRTYSLFGETAARWSLMDADEDRSHRAVADVLVAASLEFGSGHRRNLHLGAISRSQRIGL